MELISKRFRFGLLYYPAEAILLRFRLNTAFKPQDIDFLFDHLELITNEVFLENETPNPLPFDAKIELEKISNTYAWHEALTKTVLGNQHASFDRISSLFQLDKEESLVLINEKNFEHFSDQISEIQKIVYEKTPDRPKCI